MSFVQPDVTTRLPGVTVDIFLSGDVGLSAPNNKACLWAYMSSSGTATPNLPVRVLSQDQADLLFGASSMASQMYAAARTAGGQPDLYVLPLTPPSGGTAQVFEVEFAATPSAGVLGSNTTAAKAGTVRVRYRGRGVSVSYKAGDSFESIATACETAWNKLSAPPATVTRSTAKLSFTSPHKGAFNNGAISCVFDTPDSGVSAIAATLTFSGVAAVTGSGSAAIGLGSKTLTATIADTNTAAQSATAVVAKALLGSYPVVAAQPASPSGVVTLFYTDRPIRPTGFTVGLTNVATQTLAISKGTAGAGNPTLTDALSAMAAADAAFKHAVFWNSTSECSAIAEHVETEFATSAGAKGQCVFYAGTDGLTALLAADLAEQTTPRLSTSSRHVPLWAPFAACAPFELTARLASVTAGVSTAEGVGTNWNGFLFASTADAPLVGIHAADAPSREDCSAAIAAGYPPVVTDGNTGQLKLLWGGTARKVTNALTKKIAKLSAELSTQYMRADLAQYLAANFDAKKLKTGTPRSAKSVTALDVQAAAYRWLVRMDAVDLSNAAEPLRDAVIVAPDVNDPTRLFVNIPFDVVADLDQIAVAAIVR